MDHRRIGRIDHRAGAHQRGDHPAAVDIADQHHRHPRRAREAHIGDVAAAQIDLGRAPRALDHDDIGLRAQAPIAGEHVVEQTGTPLAPVRRSQRPAHLPVDDQLRGAVALRLEQHRVHVDMRRDARGERLRRLRAADLAAIGSDRGVVRHVLRLERAHDEPAIGERATQAGDQHRFADVRPRALQHHSTHATPPATIHSSAHPRR